jgi:hypothetical protein
MNNPPNTLKLRWNWRENCWEVWNYLSNGRSPADRIWRWFKVDTALARTYANSHIPISVEDTVC